MVRTLLGRLYNDYVRSNRVRVYRALVELAARQSYTIVPVGAFPERRRDGGRILVLRHDVDTAAELALQFAAAEEAGGGRGSYFFRLQTADADVMTTLAAAGHEVGYHYEELATVAKRRGMNDPGRAKELIPEAQELFLRNLDALRRRTGLPLTVAASHGDFANRALGCSNRVLLADPDFRRTAGIALEAYDPEVEEGLDCRVLDRPYPREWQGGDPEAALSAGARLVVVVTHPRQWESSFRHNGREDLTRLYEGTLFRAGIPLPSLRPLASALDGGAPPRYGRGAS